jgi:hypothetical protein
MAMSERGRTSTASRSVAWWPVHEFMAALLAHANDLPPAGTPAWCALSDGDPRKLLAVAAAGEHHVLRVEMAQEAQAEASKSVAAAADWCGVAREMQQRQEARQSGLRIERKVPTA